MEEQPGGTRSALRGIILPRYLERGVELRDQRICVGEDLACETGFEHVNVLIGKDQVQAKFRVSNVYRREGSEWKTVHHHVDFDPRILEIVSKLQTSPQM
jgi:ketosteroid isomerase-like protein